MPGLTAPTDARPITGEELARLPGVGSCELIEGRIVRMSPTGGEHGRIEGNFYRALDQFASPGQRQRATDENRLFAGDGWTDEAYNKADEKDDNCLTCM